MIRVLIEAINIHCRIKRKDPAFQPNYLISTNKASFLLVLCCLPVVVSTP